MKILPIRYYRLRESNGRVIARVQPSLGFYGRLIRR